MMMMMKEEGEGEKENESERRCCGLAEREMQKQDEGMSEEEEGLLGF